MGAAQGGSGRPGGYPGYADRHGGVHPAGRLIVWLPLQPAQIEAGTAAIADVL